MNDCHTHASNWAPEQWFCDVHRVGWPAMSSGEPPERCPVAVATKEERLNSGGLFAELSATRHLVADLEEQLAWAAKALERILQEATASVDRTTAYLRLEVIAQEAREGLATPHGDLARPTPTAESGTEGEEEK